MTDTASRFASAAFIRNTVESLQRTSVTPGRNRKVIQVTTDSTSVTVLCDDGSLWVLPEHGEHKGRWRRLPPIPQEE